MRIGCYPGWALVVSVALALLSAGRAVFDQVRLAAGPLSGAGLAAIAFNGAFAFALSLVAYFVVASLLYLGFLAARWLSFRVWPER